MSVPEQSGDAPPDDDVLAGEFALGVLDEEARGAAQRRVQQDPAFAARVASWQQRFGPLFEEVAPVAAPGRVWQGLEGRLFPGPAGPDGQLAGRLRARLRLWRLATGLAAASALALAVALALVLGGGAGRGPAPAPLIASLHGEAAGPIFLARLDREAGRLVVRQVAAAAAQATVPELWLIPADGRPRSLGLLAPAGATELVLPGPLAAMAGPDSALAISLEPPGGSPTGQPTGPVVAVGQMESL